MYLNALKEKDLSAAPLADDIYFEDPIAGKGRSSKDYLAFLTGFCYEH